MDITAKDYLRYQRHVELPSVGEAGQQALLAARVLIVGAGGLGTPAAAYLAAAGIGTLTIIDDDTIDRTNLQRQILYRDSDIGKLKVDCLQSRLKDLNPTIAIQSLPFRLDENNADQIIDAHDLVIDGSDNFSTKYLLNELCVRYRKPLVYGAVIKFDGQLSVFYGYEEDQPCYRCFYPQMPDHTVPSCTESAVLGPLVGMVGAAQAIEAIKTLLKLPTIAGKIILFNAFNSEIGKINLTKNPRCPVCSNSKDRQSRD